MNRSAPDRLAVNALKVSNLRCFEHIDISLDPGVNVLVGDNGHGKSTLLEAIYLLGRGASFRQTPGRRLIRDGSDSLSVFAQIDGSVDLRRLAVVRDNEGSRVNVDGSLCRSWLPVLHSFPVLITEPGSHRILEDGPSGRRKLMDWVVFHVEQSFMEHWRGFARCLRQRNAALRQGDRAQAALWATSLAQAGESVHAMRVAAMSRLSPRISELAKMLIGVDGEIEVRYRSGWLAGVPYQASLETQLESDLVRGHTQSGPHRAELSTTIDRQSIRDRLSRGQLRLLVVAIMLAQAEEIVACNRPAPILLVDDFGAELGTSARERLWSCLRNSGSQIVVTSLEDMPILKTANRMFHVKHDGVTRML